MATLVDYSYNYYPDMNPDAIYAATTTILSNRWLQEDDTNTTTNSTTSSSTSSSTTDQNQSAILRTTFKVYGSILAISFILFCYVRRRFPRPYTIRKWVDELKVGILYV